MTGAVAATAASRGRGGGARGPRPRARAPERHRAARARDGRGADRRGGRRRLRPACVARASRPASEAGSAAGTAYESAGPMCGIVGYVGHRPVQELLLAGLREARIPRLRLRRHLRPGRRRARVRARRRQPRAPARGGRASATASGAVAVARAAGDDRHRPHALGHARPRHRGERPPALRHRRPRPRRRQRHRRELHGAQAASSLDDGRRLHVRDRRRGHRPPRRRSHLDGGDLAEAVRAAYAELRGPLRVRRDAPPTSPTCSSARARSAR